MKKAVTINDIALQLNMSRNTVAKALNGKHVPEATRIKVLEKAKELNYKSMSIININETNEKKKNSFLLLSGKPLCNIRFFTPIIRRIENYCYENEYELFQFTHKVGTSTFEVLKDYIISLNVNGIIAIETFEDELIDKLLKLNIPVCFIDFSTSRTTQIGNYDIIVTSSFNPIYELTKKLYRRYHIKKFSFVGDESHCLSFQERYFGMICALTTEKIMHSSNEDILKNDSFDYGNINMLKAEICNLPRLPDCFICGNDFIARNVTKALEQLGKHVPKDAFVIGFDNVPDAFATTPKITSIGTNSDEIGETAVNALVNRINNPNHSPVAYKLQSTIYERESTYRNN